MLDSAQKVKDLRAPPNNKLEHLKSDRINQYSIRVNDQWRLCFEWFNQDAISIEIVDYH